MESKTITGVIERVTFTLDSFGEQYVTISGEVYMTSWPIQLLKVGSEVEIDILPPPENCWIGGSEVIFNHPRAYFRRFILQNDHTE